MIYHTYGSTGIELSAIGFGGMRFTNQDDVDACASLLKTAYDAGINYFDTAPGYEKSEDLFGVALKEMNKTRDQKPFYVSTKSSKADPKEIRKNLETSLRRLNLEYIDFYHLWYVLSLDAYYDRKAKGALAEFERLKDEGLIKHICVSTHMAGPDITKMLADYPFDGVLLGYSAMNFAYRQEGLEAAAKLNRGVVVMNPLGGGIIPQNPDRFEFVKTQPNESVVQGALRFLLNDPRITVALVGFSDQKQIAEAVSAVEGYRPIPPGIISNIRENLTQAFNELCTCCRYCDNCPEGIDVPKMMDAYNHYVLRGGVPEMIEQLDGHWNIDLKESFLHQCTECGQCEEACTQKLPIRERLQFMRAEVQRHLRAKATKKKKA